MRTGFCLTAFGLFAGLVPVVAQHEPAPALRIRYPDKTWALTADLDGFVLGEPRLNHAGNLVMMHGYDPESGLILSVRLEPAEVPGDATVCRRYRWGALEKRTPGARAVELGEHGRMAWVEFLVPMTEGAPAEQKQVHAYLAHDGVWIDIHLTTGIYEPEVELALARALWKFGITPSAR